MTERYQSLSPSGVRMIRSISVPRGYAVEERMVDDPSKGDREAVVWEVAGVDQSLHQAEEGSG